MALSRQGTSALPGQAQWLYLAPTGQSMMAANDRERGGADCPVEQPTTARPRGVAAPVAREKTQPAVSMPTSGDLPEPQSMRTKLVHRFLAMRFDSARADVQ